MAENVTENLKKLGENIEKRRKKLGMSRAELAQRIGLSINSVSGYARGKQQPTFETLCKLADALETTLVELMGGELQNLQTENLISQEREKAVEEYQLGEAENIFSAVGWDFERKNGKIGLVRRKSLEEIEDFLNEGTKIKLLMFDSDETLIAMARVVRDTALQIFNSSAAADNLNKKLSERIGNIIIE